MMQLNQGENAGGDKWSTTLAAKPCATKRKKNELFNFNNEQTH